MQRVNSLLSAGVTLTSTGTAVASPIPRDSAGYWPEFVRVVATGAGCYVKVGGIGVTAVSGDCMIQPLDGEILCVKGCKAISALTVSGTSSITVVPLERGSWSYDSTSLDYTFTSLTSLPSTITFARADATTCATYFNSSGVLSTAAANIPRFDYDPVTLAPRGLLIEESRTNLLLQSGWAGATSGSPGGAPTSWTVGFGSGTATTVTSSIYGNADGAQAVKFDVDAAERVYFAQTITVVSGTQYAVSAYLEAVTGTIGDMITVAAGTATATVNTAVTSPTTTGRKTLLFTANANGTLEIRVGVGTTATIGVTSSATISRPVCEAGAFATSSTAVTRAADSASMTGTNFSSWYNQSAGTFMVDWMAPVINAGVAKYAFTASDGTANNRLAMYVDTSATTTAFVVVGGAAQEQLTVASESPMVATKTATAFAANDFANSSRGLAVTTDTSGTMPSGLTTLTIGDSISGSRSMNGWIRRLTYYPSRLANSTLQALST